MQLEDCFDFLAPDDIRIKGTRIGIETVFSDYIHRARRPEEIACDYASLTLEQAYATILYYLHNTEAVTAYLSDWLARCLQAEAEYDRNPPAVVEKLKQIRAQRAAAVEQVG